MRKITLLLATALSCLICNAQQINKYGVPFITNYKPTTVQTLGIAQDQRGIIYFANDDGIIEYDGSVWNKIDLIGTKSLSIDEDNIVHVGTEGDFGYLYPNLSGQLKFVSLASKVPDSIQVSGIYKTYSHGKQTYYCSLLNIFVAEKDSIVKIIDLPEKSWFTFMQGDTLIISNSGNEMTLYFDNRLHYTNLETGGLYGIVPYKNGEYLMASGSQVYKGIISEKNTLLKIRDTNPFIDNLYKKHIPYDLSRYGDNFIMSTIMGDKYSILVMNSDLEPIYAANKQCGLGSINAVCCLQLGHILWAGLDNRISKIEIGNAIHHFGSESGLEGAINDIFQFEGVMYIGTNGGVFRYDFDEFGLPKFTQIDTYMGQKFIEFAIPGTNRKMMIVGGAVNITMFENGQKCNDQIRRINGQSLMQSKKHPELLYIGSNTTGLYCYKYQNRGKTHWEKVYNILEDSDIFSIAEDKDGNIWCSTDRGIFKITEDGKSFLLYDEENGLPSIEMATVKNINGRILFLTIAGIYELNESESTFEPSDFLGQFSADTTIGTLNLSNYKDGYILSRVNMNTQTCWLDYVRKNDQGEFYLEKISEFKKLPNDANFFTYTDNESNLWIGIDDILYCYNPELIDKNHPYYKNSFNAHVRQIIANDTIVLFGGAFKSANGGIALSQPKNEIVEIPYSENSLTFRYSSTFYDSEDKTEYSTMIEGDDKTWSKWKNSTEYSRMHLSEGNYTFKVKARNIYGVESEVATFAFTIKPPFYRTIVAYLLYVILLVVLVYGIVKWNTHRLIEEKKKLEQKIAEATEEIRGQNVQLEQQKDEIEKQKDEIQSSINYARRIQRALLTPDEVIDKIFPDHFLLYKPRNVVSGDYYWFGQFGDYKVSIVADCTGHGVPGGFMSMLGMTNLNYIVGQELRPDEILNKLRNAIITSLRQKDDSIQPTGDEKADRRAAFAAATEKKDRSQDGMDVAMYVLNEKEMTLSFAGANNPLVLIRDGEVEVVKASKMPVGIYAKLDPFERVDMEIKKGDCLYTFSDGFQDQFGYESGKKFMSKHLREVLLEIHQKPMAEQKEILNKIYKDWRGPADHQTDDVVLMGVRI